MPIRVMPHFLFRNKKTPYYQGIKFYNKLLNYVKNIIFNFFLIFKKITLKAFIIDKMFYSGGGVTLKEGVIIFFACIHRSKAKKDSNANFIRNSYNVCKAVWRFFISDTG